MIVRLLSRYADAHVRRRLAHLTEERRRLVGLLRQARAELRAAREELDINDEAWRAELAAERARTQETHQ